MDIAFFEKNNDIPAGLGYSILTFSIGGNTLLSNQIKIARNTARILTIALLMIWGTFFVEHLSWFFVEINNAPPIKTWFAQGLHFLLLIGYITILKWEKIGSVLVVVNAVLFFSYVAGVNAIPLTIVSVFPVMLYAFCWMKENHNSSTAL